MCLKWSCCRTACIRYQHRCLNFHESLCIQKTTDTADNFGTFDECIFYFRIHDQVYISLTITGICVSQTMEFLRQNLKALGKKCNFCRMNRNLTCFCLEYFTFDTENITYIIFLEICVGLFSDIVTCHIGLNAALQILNIAERSFSHNTFEHHTTRNAYGLSFQLIKVIFDFHAVMCHIIFGDLKRIFSTFLKILQFLTTNL